MGEKKANEKPENILSYTFHRYIDNKHNKTEAIFLKISNE